MIKSKVINKNTNEEVPSDTLLDYDMDKGWIIKGTDIPVLWILETVRIYNANQK